MSDYLPGGKHFGPTCYMVLSGFLAGFLIGKFVVR